ncbi:MAG: FHA domain-containing protein [Treponemataceae bacterium]|nr:FHA domain-containing protein [Treponemataceae bacterium]
MRYKYCEEGHIMDPSWKHCPVCLAPLAGWLLVLEKDDLIRKYYTIHEGKSFLGSGVDCEIRVLNQGLSRQQAYITITDGICSIVDMGNGASMKVNNVDTTKSTLIDGDIVSFGDTSLKIKLI